MQIVQALLKNVIATHQKDLRFYMLEDLMFGSFMLEIIDVMIRTNNKGKEKTSLFWT